MGVLKIINNLSSFTKQYYAAMDRALATMAVDIERLSKSQVPIKKGQLRASGYHRKVGILDYRVVYNKEYARFQEFGGDEKRTVRKYTYPGKKKFYLKDPGDLIAERKDRYMSNELSKIHI